MDGYEGRVAVAGETVKGPHAAIGMVFQEESTFPWRTVIENVAFPLEITGVANPETLLTVSVHLKAASAPASDTGVEVGTFAAVKNGGKVSWPSGRLVFDITNAMKQFGGQETTVLLIPHRIGDKPDQKFPPLKYDKMQIITRRP